MVPILARVLVEALRGRQQETATMDQGARSGLHAYRRPKSITVGTSIVTQLPIRPSLHNVRVHHGSITTVCASARERIRLCWSGGRRQS